MILRKFHQTQRKTYKKTLDKMIKDKMIKDKKIKLLILTPARPSLSSLAKQKTSYYNINDINKKHFSNKNYNKEFNMKSITLETIYKKVIRLQRDVDEIKKALIEEPELRNEFIVKMKDIDNEKSVMIKNFRYRYGIK